MNRHPMRAALPLALALLPMMAGCSFPIRGSGVSATNGFQINDFRQVELRDNISLRVTPGLADEATLTCDDNLIDHIEVDVSGGVLELGYERGIWGSPRTDCVLVIHRLDLQEISVSGSADAAAQGELPALRRLDISGSGSVRIGQGAWAELSEGESGGSLVDAGETGLLDDGAPSTDPLDGIATASTLDIDISGSGEVTLAGVRGDRLDVDISGSGDVDLSKVHVSEADARVSGSGSVRFGGDADRVEARVSGSGEVFARRLTAQRAVISVSGSGEIEVTAEESVKINISGSGDVTVWGDPDDRDRSVSGSGDITFR